MASNRPLFDDEDLPNWLKAAGITYGGKKGHVPSPSPTQPQTGSDDMSWLSEEPASPTAEAAGPFVPASDASLPWLQDIAPEQLLQPAGASPWGETPPWESAPVESEAPSNELPFSAPPWESAPAEPEASSNELPFGAPPWEAPSVPDQETPETKPGVTGLLPWRQGVSDDQASIPVDDQDRLPWEEPTGNMPVEQSTESDWLQDFSLADTQQPETPSASPVAESDFGWLDQSPAESGPFAPPESAIEDDLSWLEARPSEPTPPEAQPAAPEPAFDDLSWLEARPAEPTLPEVQPAAPEPAFDDLSWLDEAAPDTTPAAAQPAAPEPTPPAEPDAWAVPPDIRPLTEPPSTPIKPLKRLPSQPETSSAVEPPPAQTPIRRLPSHPETPLAAEPPAQIPIRRLPSTPPATPAQPPVEAVPRPIQKLPLQPEPQAEPDLSNMTYEEWEQSQIAKEQEALSDPADKLLDEVPEWFSQSETPPPSAPAQSGPEFLPDWYMGMEEQSTDEAPDWFRNADLSSTSLAGPETVAVPPSEPEVAAPADDVPDWFKGAGTENIDFNAMFGAQPGEPEPLPAEPQDAPPAAELELPPLVPPAPSAAEIPLPPLVHPAPPAAEAPVGAAPEPLDWMSELPNLTEWIPGETVQPAEEVPFPNPVEAVSQEPTQDLDLDFGSFSPAPEEEQAPASAQASDLGWLTDEGSAPAEPVEPTVEAADVPAWMFDQAETTPTESEQAAPEIPETLEEPEESELAESDIPAWMRDIAPTSANPPQPAEAASELDWLAGFEAPSIPSISVPPPPSALPAALTPQPMAEAKPSGAPNEVDLNLPVDIEALLSLSSQGGPSEPELDHLPSVAPVIPIDQGQQALARMDDFDLDELLGPVPEETQAPGPETIDLDELMAEALPSAVRAEPSEPAEPTEPPRAGRLRRIAETPAQPAESSRPREELPEWLEEMRLSEMPVALHIGDQEVRIQEKPVVQMNDQLRQLREHARSFHEKSAPSPAPSAGPLSGITGTIQTIPEAIQPGTMSIPTAITAGESQSKRVKLIQRMLEMEDAMFRERAKAEDEAQAKPTAQVAVRPHVKIDRYVLTLLLAVALIVPFFVDGLNIVPAPALDQLNPAQNSVAQVVDTIQPQQPVLVAFEYGPTAAGELDDLARAILRDIIKRGGRPVIVSTNPVGALRGQMIMALLGTRAADLQVMNRTQPLVARQDYVVLRYLPGGMVGARSAASAVLSGGFQQQVVFSTDIEGKPSGLADVSGLKTSPAFVVAETADDVRNWAEQYQAPVGEKPFTLVFLTSAGASAVADTYVRSVAQTDKHLLGPLVGLRDTMTYQAVRQVSPASSTSSSNPQKVILQRWQSVGLSALLAGVIILIGMTINMIRSLQRRGRR